MRETRKQFPSVEETCIASSVLLKRMAILMISAAVIGRFNHTSLAKAFTGEIYENLQTQGELIQWFVTPMQRLVFMTCKAPGHLSLVAFYCIQSTIYGR